MPDIIYLIARTRMEIGDVGKTFQESFVASGTETRYVLSHAPVDAPSLSVFLDSVDITDNDEGEGVQVEESTGTLIFDFLPVEGAVITAAGTSYRFLTDDELTVVCQESVLMHTKDRVDLNGRPIDLDTLPMIEITAVATLCAVNSLYVLSTDASFDIDVQAPDGMNVPRSERYRQLMETINLLKERYREMCELLNIGMHGIQVFSARRLSKRTNRYVPLYTPQEIDDRAKPMRAEIELPTYGTKVRNADFGSLDLTIPQGNTFSQLLEDVIFNEGTELRAQVRGFPGSPVIVAEFFVSVDEVGSVTISLEASQTRRMPRHGAWDILEIIEVEGEPTVVNTVSRGRVYSPREITSPDGMPQWPNTTSTSTTPWVGTGIAP